MKKVLNVLIGLAIVYGLVMYIKHDYSWEQEIIAKQEKQGKEWKVFSRGSQLDWRIWRWFKAPATTLCFVNSEKIGIIDGPILYTYVMTYSRDTEIDELREHGGIRLIDTLNKKTTLVDNNEKYNNVALGHLDKLTWINYTKFDLGYDLEKYINERFK
jgi:hypothetical protein